VHVGEHLDLHVARPVDVLLDVDGVVAERVLRLALRRVERASSSRAAHHAHALAAAPAAALSSTGYPNSPAMRRASAASRSGSVVPGTTGTPAAMASVRAAVLLPIAAIASAGGPTKTSPASRTARANHSRSARNP
jgi:hypothetical protein